MTSTLFNSFRLFGNEFQIWLPLKNSVSKPFFAVKTLETLSLNIRLKLQFESSLTKISFMKGGFSLLIVLKLSVIKTGDFVYELLLNYLL